MLQFIIMHIKILRSDQKLNQLYKIFNKLKIKFLLEVLVIYFYSVNFKY